MEYSEHTRLSTRQYRYSPLTRYARNLLKKVNRVLNEYKFLSDEDRVCVAVSGGKDSLSLLHLLLEHRRFYNGKHSIGAVHVVSDFAPNAQETRDYIASLCSSLDVPCDFPEISVTTGKDGQPCAPSCFWCAWRRRQTLFDYTVRQGYTRLALGHHSDDVAETTLLNLIYHGTLETMLPGRDFFDNKFKLIRPLFYVREKDLVQYAKLAGFETSTCVCPNADLSKRKRMKEIVRELKHESKLLHENLWRAARLWWEAYGDHPLHKEKKAEGRSQKAEGESMENNSLGDGSEY
ncbi:MAG: tRNA lysidine(34) synthetase [Candidatus Latescibacterota bacterium]